ncbi:hypothetical protein C2S51_021598 [Perilla frutescens var. frutescens]|nr:hypothetical protein C2S51_021598 [Perilla frutescens var. frutescens]
MGSLSKNLLKSLSNLRLATSSTLKNLLISNRHDPDLKTGDGDEIINERLLLKRLHDSPVDGAQYLSALSPENFSATKKIYFPLFEEFKFVVGSCNGLVCLDNATNESVLWNPSTRELRIIPSGYMKNFALYATKHSFAAGFGYDYQSHDFKIIRFEDEDDKYDLDDSIAELYSLKTNSWKYIQHPLFLVMRNPSVYANGFYWWLVYSRTMPFLLCFDFATEEFSQHTLPTVGSDLGGFLHFDMFEFHDCFAVIVFPKLGTEKTFDIWLCMDGEKWTKEYNIRVPGAERPLGFWKDYRYLFFEGINRQLMVYDMMTGEVTGLDIFDYPEKFQLVPYVESTVSIKELLGSCDAASTEMDEKKAFRTGIIVLVGYKW